MSRKTGANKSEQNKIIKLANKGYSANEIAELLYILPDVVKGFMPEKSKKKVKVSAENSE